VNGKLLNRTQLDQLLDDAKVTVAISGSQQR